MGCAPTTDVPAVPHGEAAHRTTVSVGVMALNEWSGFATATAKTYSPPDPGYSDVRYVVTARGNAVFAIQLGAIDTDPHAHPDWSPTLRSYLLPIVSRADAQAPPASAHG
jgi:hypothetical protein